MHLAVDGSFWGGQERGVAVSTRRLWHAYLDHLRPARATAFGPEICTREMANVARFPIGPLGGVARVSWVQFVLPRLLRQYSVDLLYCPCYTVPLAAPCRLALTLHDLIAWSHPRLAGWRNALHLRAMVGSAVARADVICVPTHTVRRALLARFRVAAKKVFVVPWGVDLDLSVLPRERAAQEVRDTFAVDEPFALFCGCVEPKKNIQAAVDACASRNLLLLVAGPWIKGSAAQLRKSRGRFRYLGYVTPRALSALYGAATALLMPSWVEGFGLPAMEAMRHGCPVIASTDPALVEVCGGSAIHVSPEDSEGMATALRAVVECASLREDLLAQGKEQASRFTWKNSVDSFAEALGFATKD